MKKLLIWCFFLFGLLVTSNVTFAGPKTPLPPDEAFVLSAHTISSNKLTLNFRIAPGTFLYAERFRIQLLKPFHKMVNNISFPKNTIKIKTKLNEEEIIYKNQLAFTIELPKNNASFYQLAVRYQGCSDSGYCYPPRQKIISFDTKNINQIEITTASAQTLSPNWLQQQKQALTEPDRIIAIFSSQSLPILIIAFFLFGLLLSLTPCVLPMVPILSNIILGQKNTLTTKKGFLLSLSYVLGMSLTYSILGIVAALLGYSLQATFQNPYVLSIFALIFILLSLASFGVYQLQPPTWFRDFLTKQADLSGHKKQRGYISAAIMGSVSSIVISPCVTAPFVGALAYISQTGNVLLGGASLFVLGLGMGVPLLITGIAGGKILPHAGKWMEKVKELFGVLLLFVAVELISRFSNQAISNALWAITFFIGALLFFRTEQLKKLMSRIFWRMLAVIFLMIGIYFVLQINSVKNFIYPATSNEPNFSIISVTNFSQLETQLQIAKSKNKPVILDFYADWCRACKDMEQVTFHDPTIKSVFKNFQLIRVDISANDLDAQTLMQHYQVIAPPVLIFLSKDGIETSNNRIVGEVDATSFKKFAEGICSRKQMFACLDEQ